MSLHALANHMAARGRGTDSTLVHMSPREVQGLQSLAMANGGTLTINPQTGLPEAGFLENLLPALAGFALNAFMPGVGGAIGGALGLAGTAAETVGTGLLVGGATGLATGSLEKGLMAGLGAYGGAGLESGLNAAGKSALETASSAGAGKGAFLPGAETAPSSTLDRLQAGIGAYGKAPYDALKDNAMNLGLASAPFLAGTFDDQQTNAPKQQIGKRYMYKVDPLTGQSYAYKTYTGDEIKDSPAVRFGNANGGLMRHYDDGGTVTRDFLKDPVRFGNVTAPVDKNNNPIVRDLNDTRSDSQKAEDYLMGKGPNPFLFYHKPPVVDPVQKAAEATKTLQEEIKQAKQGGGGGNKAFDETSGIAGLNKDTSKTGWDAATDLGLKAANSGIPGITWAGDKLLAAAELAKGNTPNLSSPFTLDPAQKQLLANQTQAETNRLAALQAAAAEQKRLEDESRAETERLKAANELAKQAEQERIANETKAEANRLEAANNAAKIAAANNAAKIAEADAAFKSSNPSGYSIGPAPTSIPAASPMTQDPAQQQTAAMRAAQQAAVQQAAVEQAARENAAKAQVRAAEQAAAEKAASDAAAAAKAESDARDARESAAKAAIRAAEDAAGKDRPTTTSDKTLSEHVTGQDKASEDHAQGGYIHYADGGATGSGSIDLHVPINFGGGQGGMGGGLGSLSGGFGGGNGIQQRGMSQPSPDFLGQQQQSLPGFQAMQKAQQDYTNSDEYKGFQKYAQQYQQSLGGQSGAFGAFGGGMGGMRGGLGLQGGATDQFGGTTASAPNYSMIENTRQVTNGNPRMMMAAGGIAALADGGMYNLGSYSDGGRLLRGPGDGVSDDIPATIGENQPARLADGEFVVPARIVSELGNGSTEAGARKLYAMMDRVQKSRSKTVGKDKIAANTRADKYLPA